MDTLPSLAAIAFAYLLGSVSFAVVVSRAMGLADPRSYGSRNPGATNVLRTGNRRAALLTLIGDAAKGVVAVLLVQALAPTARFGEATIAFSALAVFIGHLFPVFHGFAGGKGVATAAGVLLALSLPLGLVTLGAWLLTAFVFRYSSLAALIAALVAPLYQGLFVGFDITALIVLTMSGLLVWRHLGNIANLIAGRESRIGQKKDGARG